MEQHHTNRLSHEKSPYLLQHASNPVDWYPWGSEAFEKALRENKPIFLSIGYSTCHWCHVMEHESFEDADVARLMNETFVAIKVDREERPDIDNVYMSVCQMLSGGGGWPLTIIMTPDKKPFFAGTYFPRDNRFGRIGMIELIGRIADIWKNRHSDVITSAAQITAALGQTGDSLTEPSPDASTLQAAFEQLAGRFDRQFGGFGSAPKFPTPHNLMFLLRHWKRTGNSEPLAIVEQTLTGMRRGGICDQIGFGFHRYSTDREWLLPHFEKMLYDQALLIMAYTEAYQATGKDEYRQTAREIITYVLRDMTSAEGGFYSAEDADSEGEEGKFYVWGEDELRRALTKDDFELFIRAYGIEPEGNYTEQSTQKKTGWNIPYLKLPLNTLAHELRMPEAGLRQHLERIRRQLYDIREKRIHPHKDDKILTDWNGLMIAALAKAAQAFEESGYADAATRAADFILAKLRTPDGRLRHRYRDNDAAIGAHVDDYAFLIWGLLELYEASFDARHLKMALELNSDLVKHFWDPGHGGFFLTADDAEELIARPRESYDGAIPSGNSVAMLNLLRLAHLTGNAELEHRAAQISRAFASDLAQQPSAHTQMLQAVDFALGPVSEVVIVGALQAEDTKELLRVLRGRFLPHTVILLRPVPDSTPSQAIGRDLPQAGSSTITELADFTAALTSINGTATAYVCRNFACQRPTTDPREIMRMVEAG